MPTAPPGAECYVGNGIQSMLSRVFKSASQALCLSLEQTTIADVLRDVLAEYEVGAWG